MSLSMLMLSSLSLVCLIGLSTGHTRAICNLQVNSALPTADKQLITGSVVLTQDEDDVGVTLKLDIKGFDTTKSNRKHGFHIHESSDFSGGCDSAGRHFNPFSVTHGSLNDGITTRHVGDLGNIEHDDNGYVFTRIYDNIISFSGETNITNRAIVIHADEDDLGTGGDAGSAATGNAGKRLACCAIKMDTGNDVNTAAITWPSYFVALSAIFMIYMNTFQY